jgi:hypothetical protein
MAVLEQLPEQAPEQVPAHLPEHLYQSPPIRASLDAGGPRHYDRRVGGLPLSK